ncbi:zinc-finger domain-containing protein [Methylophaga nitratireducenticrescens]|uniref:Uncharacterized protein n=1 Tax=Methylophaga nitratireducenticrescens TaxID=754476 RepID=I1XGG6_METNJ|nr:zinc-finger domain-containing protein [Methylophaga nitratireducenticrescens]AFI83485.1 zinc-finger domain-containing protein [Methylophaga nitratireducenticrescens]AUZ83583.1 zinc-finger domain-containing protein [Methylophaga nitratireducenticrescens]
MSETKQACTQRRYEVSKKDLPISCPMPDMPAWNAHPRVYLEIKSHGEVLCPYCSTLFVLKN